MKTIFDQYISNDDRDILIELQQLEESRNVPESNLYAIPAIWNDGTAKNGADGTTVSAIPTE
jgi:hypothetical protein